MQHRRQQVRPLGWEDSLKDKKGNPPQYFYLENSMDRGAWRATVHGIARVGHNLVLSIFIVSTDAEASLVWPPDKRSQLIGKDPEAGKD